MQILHVSFAFFYLICEIDCLLCWMCVCVCVCVKILWAPLRTKDTYQGLPQETDQTSPASQYKLLTTFDSWVQTLLGNMCPFGDYQDRFSLMSDLQCSHTLAFDCDLLSCLSLLFHLIRRSLSHTIKHQLLISLELSNRNRTGYALWRALLLVITGWGDGIIKRCSKPCILTLDCA